MRVFPNGDQKKFQPYEVEPSFAARPVSVLTKILQASNPAEIEAALKSVGGFENVSRKTQRRWSSAVTRRLTELRGH